MVLRSRNREGLLLTLALLFAALIALLAPTVSAVRSGDFKKCADSSFCRRIRRLSSYVDTYSSQAQPFESPYYISSGTVSYDKATSTLVTSVKSALHPQINFELKVHFYEDGTSRVMMDQVGHRYGNWKRYDGAASWAIDQQPVPAPSESVKVDQNEKETQVRFGENNMLTLTHKPLKAVFSRGGVPQIILNGRGLLHMEHYRPKPDPFPTPKDEEQAKLFIQSKKRSFESVGYAEYEADRWAGFEEEDSGEWEESFGGKQDSKPKGPEALSLDIEFPGKEHVFGLPEHASPLNLRSTKGDKEGDFEEPYRLMNTDVFEYDYDSPMSLYGSIPVLHAQSANSAASILWLTASETWVDIDRSSGKEKSTRTHFFSESGILDLFVFLKDTPTANLATYSQLVGRTPLPAYFALGYHQCRWNYLTTDDVLNVNARFSEEDIPMDVLWLDIEYAKEHWYGVWNDETFPKPERMLEGLDAEGRKLVIIIDPHLARKDEYFLYKDAVKHDVLVKMPDNKTDYEGWCWSGSASWIDNLNPAFWPWWVTQFNLAGQKIKANARNMHFWLDMNEPAIFNGPEVTAPKDVKHYGGWEHRDIHNLYSVAYHNASSNAVKLRETPHHRPFTLARGWWIGTWKAGAIWTGDNLGTWEHLAVSVPMILANNIGGMSFCGADVGGFFGNPSPDFLLRWYQAGIFEPFFRAHAHIDTKRREPYLLEEPHRSAVRDLIKLRYKMLPMWYSAFKESSHGGLPVLRPQFLMFPDDPNGYAIDTQYYIGDSGLLVHPAVKEGVTSVDVYLAEEQPYYDFFNHHVYYGSSTGKKVSVPAPLTSQVPALLRGGSVFPLRERVRRSAELGWRDPFTLVIALNKPSSSSSTKKTLRATGKLYLDDGDTYAYEKGDFIWKRFTWHTSAKRHTLRSVDEASLATPSASSSSVSAKVTGRGSDVFVKSIDSVRVERLVILGLDKAPKSITVKGGESVPFTWTSGVSASGGLVSGTASKLIVKDPKVLVVQDWEIIFE